MEPLNDDELKQALQQWKAPDAPASLERRVLPRAPFFVRPSWRWLLSGSVRIPVPALIAAVVIVVAIYASRGEKPNEVPAKPTVSLSDFQPVPQLKPVVVVGGQK